MAIQQAGPHELRVELTAPTDSYLLFVHLLVPHEGTRFPDNYVDLEPGETRVLSITNTAVELTRTAPLAQAIHESGGSPRAAMSSPSL